MADGVGSARWARAVTGLAAMLALLGFCREGLAQAQFDGAWAGPTSQQAAVSFSVANNAVTSFAITFTLTGTNCVVTGSIVRDLSSAPVGISGNSFSVQGTEGGVSFAFAGFFTSPVVASGSIIATSLPTPTGAPCRGTATVSWAASPAPPPAPIFLSAAVLPGSRSVLVGQPATAFVSIANAGPGTALRCRITAPFGLPVTFAFQATSPTTNQPTGQPNAPVDIPAGAIRTFVITFTPFGSFAPVTIALGYLCENAPPAATIIGVNTFLLSASTSPVPDVVALATTQTGDGIVTITGPTGSSAFAVATVNLGAPGTLTVSADTGQVVLPVSLAICQTNPSTGDCLAPPTPTVSAAIATNARPTFAVFVTASAAVLFAPERNRIFVRFTDQSGAIRGSTSVAVQTSTR